MRLININKCFSSIDIDPDDLAVQLTLIDLPIFKSIKMDEFTNLADRSYNRSNKKQDLSPNVVAMNRQFNQVTFWVVNQILSYESARTRADIISSFMKTAKSLFDLNNLHSSYAVVSALLSSPIYRLEKTWSYVKKKHSKDKSQFDQLVGLYSDNNNYELLRNHLANCNLPCIPYLGMYSRDIIYINEAYQEETSQKISIISKIIKTIERFQTSEYNNLVEISNVTSCFLSSRYIDELQKFVEDENFRRSLEIEPPDSLGDSSFGLVGARTLKRSTMLLASILHSAVLSSSNRIGATLSSRSRRSSDQSQKSLRYLIDDSFINDHTSFPPPISTSN